MSISIYQGQVFSDATPVAVTTAAGAPGVGLLASRSDHRHQFVIPDTGWLTPALLNGWLVYDATFGNAAMYRRLAGVTFIQCLIKSGTIGQPCFNLPVGFRPRLRLLIGVETSGAHARLDVDSNGDVIPNSGATSYFQITCCFPADG